MKKLLISMLLPLLALAACSGALPESTSELLPTLESAVGEVASEVEEHTSDETHWSYDENGAGGPDHWASLDLGSDKTNECGIGTQSPINLASSTAADLENIRFDYGEAAVKILNNGHTIQVDQIEGSQIVIGGETYLLKQFHFHAPSEHRLNGQEYPLEMHLVHKTADESKAAVVGIFIAEGAANDALNPVWAHLPTEESPEEQDPATGEMVHVAQATGENISLAALLPTDALFYRYDGSLTTPPCTTGILWSVMQTPIEMSAEQIAEFTSIMSGNNRPVQPLNERDLLLDATP